VTEVTEVTGHSVENIHENLNETPVTSVTRVTATAKEEKVIIHPIYFRDYTHHSSV